MKFAKRHHRVIALVALVAFAALIQGYSAPAPAGAVNGSDEATVERDADSAPGSFEKEAAEGAVAKKKKKFSWLLAGLGVVAVSIAIYFLVIKKTRYTLTVDLEAGVSGTPLATARYKKGEVVRYSYVFKPAQINLQVLLDGAPAAVSGSVVMDRDHALAVSTAKEGFVQVNSNPAGARIYLNGADSGQVTPYKFKFTTHKYVTFALRHQCGRKDWHQTVGVELGREATVNAVLGEGIYESFLIPLSPCWQARTPANWSLSHFQMEAANTTGAFEFLAYKHPFPGDLEFTVWQWCRQITKRGTVGLIFSTSSDMADSWGYEFAFIDNDKYVIYRNNGYDHFTDTGFWSYIKRPTPCPGLKPGTNVMNWVKIVKAGSNYTFIVNNKFVYSFVDPKLDARYVALGIFDQGMQIKYDGVLLTVGDTSNSVPGQPLEEIPATASPRRSGI